MMRTTRWSMVATAVAAAMSLTTGRADAAFATYTETVTGSGSLDGRIFNNALITITGTGDTNNITTPAGFPGVSFLAFSSNTVTVAGLDPDSFTLGNLGVAANRNSQSGGFAFGPNGTAVLGLSNPSFATYALDTSVGPFSGAGLFNAGTGLSTSRGSLIINSVSSAATFQANVTPSSVPEPSSIALCGIAAAFGLGGWARRARRHAV